MPLAGWGLKTTGQNAAAHHSYQKDQGQLPGYNEIPASLVDIPEASPQRG